PCPSDIRLRSGQALKPCPSDQPARKPIHAALQSRRMRVETVMRRSLITRGGSLRSGVALTLLAVVAGPWLRAYGAEHITLRNGFELDCARREVAGDRVRLYLLPTVRAGAAGQMAAQDANYIEVAANSVLRVEQIPDPPAPPPTAAAPLALPLVLLEPARTVSAPL